MWNSHVHGGLGGENKLYALVIYIRILSQLTNISFIDSCLLIRSSFVFFSLRLPIVNESFLKLNSVNIR